MITPLRSLRLALGALALAALPALAALDTELAAVQRRWDQIKYEMPASEATAAFAALAEQAHQLTKQYPERAEAWSWAGIADASLAESKGGLGALSTVKRARRELERAIEIDAATLDGSALVTLGSIYYQVPGWPLGFGDNDKARAYLKRALGVAPDNIDTNFWYAHFLADQGQFDAAATHARHALEAPPRPGREAADAGQRTAAQALLDRIDRERR